MSFAFAFTISMVIMLTVVMGMIVELMEEG
ncbi:hypothetical protein SAMN05421687_102149 [Salimicrobium flavidum]|uniref:Uncharacterized protein n=1 Tax=Salimicrobium flavidum TaxID=570947 RepID=A0A1N7ITC1_9BACI|nr:hypothetical protein SAMN05421687_102149 [Salimicrobium flavidum]